MSIVLVRGVCTTYPKFYTLNHRETATIFQLPHLRFGLRFKPMTSEMGGELLMLKKAFKVYSIGEIFCGSV